MATQTDDRKEPAPIPTPLRERDVPPPVTRVSDEQIAAVERVLMLELEGASAIERGQIEHQLTLCRVARGRWPGRFSSSYERACRIAIARIITRSVRVVAVLGTVC